MTAGPLVVRLSAAAPHSDGSADFPSRGARRVLPLSASAAYFRSLREQDHQK